jgi:hypothetical protein
MSVENDKPYYLLTYESGADLVLAQRQLFSQVYQELRARGHDVEVWPGESSDSMFQFKAVDGYDLRSRYTSIIEFKRDSKYYYGKTRHYLTIEFTPQGHLVPYGRIKGKMRCIVRDALKTPDAMSPESLADFVLKYVAKHRATEEEYNRKREIRLRVEKEEEKNRAIAMQLRDRPGAGRARVHTTSSTDGNFSVMLNCTQEEMVEALRLLDARFPRANKSDPQV